MHRFRRLQHRRRQQHSSQSDHDGSESDECIDLSSSSPASNGHGSASSDSESDNGDSLPGAWKARSLKNDGDDSDNDSTSSSNEDSESDSDEDGVNTKQNYYDEQLDRTRRMLERLDGGELKKVQQFINGLNATNKKKIPAPPKCEKNTLHSDLSHEAITPSNLLSVGLQHVGFGPRRQASANNVLNVERFIAFYGAPPEALAPLFRDVRNMFKEEKVTCRDLLIACNWLKGYDSMHVLEGRWGNCEDYMRPRIKRCQEMMQALRREKMKFPESDAQVVANVDTVSFMVQEFRQDPSSDYFDPKTKSPGVKYETGVGTDEPGKQVWLRGPFLPGKDSDITIFRGGDDNKAIADRDKDALYFKMPKGKQLAGDTSYVGEPERVIVTMPEMDKRDIKWLGRLKARGETLHSRLKNFRVLGTRFRHGNGTKDKLRLHQMATESVCLIVLYDCENGRPLFEQ